MNRSSLWDTEKSPEVLKKVPLRISTFLSDFKVNEENVGSAYLFGGARTGKSVEAVRKLLRWHKYQFINRLNYSFEYINIPTLLSHLRTNLHNESSIIEQYQKCKLLVLDDFGAEKMTDWSYQVLYLIISYRYDEMLPTIYTSNLNLQELANKLEDDRLPSRILQDCGPNIFKFENSPYFK